MTSRQKGTWLFAPAICRMRATELGVTMAEGHHDRLSCVAAWLA